MDFLKSDDATRMRSGSDGRAIDRRTVVKGAAWSVPIVAAAVAAPMSSASGCGALAGSFDTTDAGIYQQWIPQCATTVNYLVRGGGGAVANTVNGDVFGRAAEITGTLLLPADWAGGYLKLIVGAGGEARQYGVAMGGIGFGRGGNGTNTVNNSGNGETAWSLAGGGGSALLFADTVLVTAGGGGASGVALTNVVDGVRVAEPSMQTSDHALSGFPFGTGSQNKPNGIGIGMRHPDVATAGLLMGPARGAENGGTSRSATWSTTSFTVTDSYAGGDGTAFGTGLNGGGNGGAGATAVVGYQLPGETAKLPNGPVGGGGGGGYSGGAGGGFAFARLNYGAYRQLAAAVASGGGAGRSYLAGSVSGIDVAGTVGVFTEGAEVRQGHLGRVRVSWS